MLASSGHVSIGGVEYLLAVDEDPHYHHRFESLFAPTSAIAGEIAKEQIRPEKLLWAITDWSGGEGALIFYPQDPTSYDIGSLINATTRGKLTTRPARDRDLVARTGANATTEKRPAGTSAYANAFIAWEDNIITSTDTLAWTSAQDVSPAGSGHSWGDAISDGTNAAFLPADSFSATIPVVSADISTTTWLDANSGAGPDGVVVGAVLDGVPYTWALDASGILKLYKKAAVMDSVAAWDATTVYTTGFEPAGTWGTNYWTSATAAETSLFVSYASRTHTFVFESRNDVVRPFWVSPPGFSGKKLVYSSGMLFILGNNASASGKKHAGIWAIPLVTRSPLFIAAPRQHKNTEITDLSVGCPAWGSTIVAGDAVSGKIFLYDIEKDALHLFDDLVNGGVGGGVDFVSGTDRIAFLAMHGTRLFGATWEPSTGAGTSLQVFSYADLIPANRDAAQAISSTLETAEWDFGLPMELKALIGFYTTFEITDATTTSGLIANSRIKVSYSIDGGAYTDLTAITSATTPTGAKGRVFQQVSSGSATKKFTRLKVKVTLDNNSQAVAPPILLGVTAEAQPLAYAETWELVVRTEDEDSNERPGSRQNVGSFLRDNLEDLATNKNIVTFLDGYRYKQNNTYTTHTVTVEDPIDIIDRPGEGKTRLRLRAIV